MNPENQTPNSSTGNFPQNATPNPTSTPVPASTPALDFTPSTPLNNLIKEILTSTPDQREEQTPTSGGATISLVPDAIVTPSGEPTESISYSEVMAFAWNIFKKESFKLFSVLLLPYLVPLVAIIPVLSAYVYVEKNPALQSEIQLSLLTTGQLPDKVIIVILIFLVIFGLLWLIVQAWSVAAITYMTLSADIVGVRDSYRQTRSLAWKYLGVTCAVGLLVVCYVPLLIVPAAALTVYFLITGQVFIAERTSVKGALLRSFSYIKGNFWNVFALLFTWVIVALPVGVVLDQIVENTESSIVLFVAIIVRFIISLLLTAFLFCMTTSIYKSLRLKKTNLAVTTKLSHLVYPAIAGFIAWLFIIWYIIQETPVIN